VCLAYAFLLLERRLKKNADTDIAANPSRSAIGANAPVRPLPGLPAETHDIYLT